MSYSQRTTLEQRRKYRHAAFTKAKRRYRLIIHLLGGRCAWCGRDESETQLQLDHVRGKNWRANKLRLDARIKRYVDEFKAGTAMRVLCIECNSKDGRARQIEGRVSAVVEKRAKRTESHRAEKALRWSELIDQVPF